MARRGTRGRSRTRTRPQLTRSPNAIGGAAGGKALQLDANLEELGRLARIEAADQRAPVGNDLDQPLGRKAAEGLPQRPAADAEVAGQVRLDEALTGREAAIEDTVAEFRKDAVDGAGPRRGAQDGKRPFAHPWDRPRLLRQG